MEKSLLMTRYMVLLLLAIWTTSSIAQNSPEDMIDQFFKDYIKLGPEKSLDNIYSTMPWVESIQDDVDKLKAQFTDLQNIVGDYHGHDLMAQKVLAKSFSIHIYLVRFDRQPVRFVFRFYKPDKEWGLYGFSYDDILDDDLQESVRSEYLGTGK